MMTMKFQTSVFIIIILYRMFCVGIIFGIFISNIIKQYIVLLIELVIWNVYTYNMSAIIILLSVVDKNRSIIQNLYSNELYDFSDRN